jgi:hypothetical protein
MNVCDPMRRTALAPLCSASNSVLQRCMASECGVSTPSSGEAGISAVRCCKVLVRRPAYSPKIWCPATQVLKRQNRFCKLLKTLNHFSVFSPILALPYPSIEAPLGYLTLPAEDRLSIDLLA